MITKTIQCPNIGGEGTHTMAYHEWECANPKATIVGVHGLTRNGRDFDFFAESLCKEYRIICPDVAGRGESQWLVDKAAYNTGTYAMDIVHMLNSLNIKNVYWVGTSMGGLIGMVVAAMFPSYIQKFVINDIGPFIPEAALLRLRDYVGKEVQFDTIDEVEKYLRSVMAPWGITADEHWKHMAKYSFRERAGKFVLNYDPDIKQAFFAVNGDLDMWELWNKITCPILVLRGSTSDLLTHETAERMQKSRTNIDLTEFPGIGHAPALMEQDQIYKVSDWLSRE